MKVEIFTALDAVKCQTQVNQFLDKCVKNNKEVKDVKFSVTASPEGGVVYFSALVFYVN